MQAHGIHLSRLLYLSDREYALLQQLRDNFVRSIPECTKEGREVVRREPEEQVERATIKEHPSPVSHAMYEPSHISNVFDSEYWRWRRFKVYYEYVHGEELMDKRYREKQYFMNH